MTYHKKLTIGLFGFGTVGEGIYHVLKNTPTLAAEIKKICIKHPDKKRNAPAELFTTDAKELLNDDSINVIVELIDDADAAFDIVSTSLKNKKAVVSANKKMIAHHLSELLLLQNENGVPFLYEAAVCGSVPVIRNLEEYYDNDLLKSFAGIINGSTNYILTKMNDEGLSYEAALKQAQDLGFAESNPALDVEGKDALNKLAIVLLHAYGIVSSPDDILHLGITKLHPADTTYAEEKAYKIKLIAKAKRTDNNHVIAYVLPTFVENKSQLHYVRNEFNGVLIGSKLADEQFLYGKGAGRYPTSSAVLSDIAALSYDYRYEYKKSKEGRTKYTLTNDYLLRVFVSYGDIKNIDLDDFNEVEETYNSKKRNHLVGSISLDKLFRAKWLNHRDVSLIAFEEPTEEEYQSEKPVDIYANG